MPEYQFPLKDRRLVAEETMAFWFDTSGTDFTFEAGQNADYTLIDPPYTDAEGNKRSFSFAASPSHRDTVMITTRMRPTAFKNSLKEIPPGTKVHVVGPLGNMVLHEDASKPAVFLTGGIGITPFRSMIEWATEEKKPHDIFLFYSNRTPEATTFHADFEHWATLNPQLHYIPTITDIAPEANSGWRYAFGRIDEAMLKQRLPELLKPVFYMAGPPAFVLAMRKMLIGLGVGRDNIKLESFTGY